MGKRHTGLKPRSEQLFHISLDSHMSIMCPKQRLSSTTKSEQYLN
jgi:hypothetical protein